jgi:exodeoxyribonuclease VII large subunit
MAVTPAKAISVTQLVRRMKNLIEIDIGQVWVEGEVSNLKKQASGHWYFTLKDDKAQIACAMFGAKKRDGFESLNDGAKIRVYAEASVYESRGSLQIIVLRAEAAGLGDLQARFELLKQKLLTEGLFDQASKKQLPTFPKIIGIITSGTGAAIEDITSILARRAPWIQPLIIPVRVQGKGAEQEIARAIYCFNQWEQHKIERCDLLIVGRGGGSLEDLWSFNEEIVARAIAASSIPIISAVGHEIDFTIADFVADLRAATPSAAAEIATPDQLELLAKTKNLQHRLIKSSQSNIEQTQMRLEIIRRNSLQRNSDRILREPMLMLDTLRDRLLLAITHQWKKNKHRIDRIKLLHRTHHPILIFARREEKLLELQQRLLKAKDSNVEKYVQKLSQISNLLRTLGPESSLKRGFSITFDDKGEIIRSVKKLKTGEVITTKFADGSVKSNILES